MNGQKDPIWPFTPGSGNRQACLKSKKAPEGLLTSNNMFVFALFRGWVVSRLVCMDPPFCCGGLVAVSDVKMPIGAVFFRIFRPMALFCRRNA